MTDLATLVLKIDSSQVAKGVGDLDKLTAAGQRTEQSVKHMTAEQYRAIKGIEAFALATGKQSSATQALHKTNGMARIGQMELAHAIRSTVDMLIMGQRPLTAFSLEAGRVTQGVGYMAGGAGKFATFMMGPWGMALTAGVTVVGLLAHKLFEGGDAVGKMVDELKKNAREAKESERAHAIFARTIEGSILKVRELTKALAEQNRTLEDNVSLAKAAAAAALGNIGTNIGKVSGDLAGAVQDMLAAQRARNLIASGVGGPDFATALIGAEAKLQATQDRVRALTGQLNALRDAAAGGARALGSVDFPLFERNAKDAVDPIGAINTKFDDMAKKAKAAGTYTADLAKQIEKARKAAVDAANATGKGSGLFGRQMSFDEAASIARSAGLTVTSAYRSTAKQRALFNDPSVNRPGNPVAAPGSSAHEGVNGKWALDIAFAPGLTPQKLKKIYGDQGTSLTTVLKENGHFHIEGSRSDAAGAERAAQREAEKALNRQQAFQAEAENLNAEILRAKGQLSKGTDAEADFAIRQLQTEQENYERTLDRAVADKKLEATDAETLKIKHQQLTYERAKSVEQRRQLSRMQQESETAQQLLQNRIDDLKFADEMVTTSAEHREVQLQIIDVAYQQKEAALRDLKARLELAGQLEEAARVQGQIDRLPTDKAQDRARVQRGTLDPLQQWAKSVPQDAAEVIEALQSIEARGLDGLTNAITDVVTGTKSLKEAFGDLAKSVIADLIQMTVKMLIFRALSSALPGIFGGSTPSSSSIPWDAYPNIPGFATGGSLILGGRGGTDNNLISLNGRPLAKASRGEEINFVPRGSRQGNSRSAANDAAPQEIIVHVSASEEFDVKVERVAGRTVAAAAPTIVRAAHGATMRALTRPKLMGH